MNDSRHKKVIAQQDDFIIIKLCLEENTSLQKHKSKGITTIIPIKGRGIVTINGEKHPIKLGITVNLTPNDEHILFAETSLEVLVIEILRSNEVE